ncbi:MAG: PepSY-like domain-containing protein [Lewinellaceae bacterium]|nr:PepSY-like domain-containing protein [Lewinellaceae bacterium]
MKKALRSAALLFLAAVAAPALGQDSVVPKTIAEAFAKKYPQAEDVSWEELDEVYIASFLKGDYYCDAYFDKRGTWKETSTIIDEADLPKVVVLAVKGKYPSLDYFTSIVQSERPEGTLYYLGFESGYDYITLTLDEKGTILGEEVESFDGND